MNNIEQNALRIAELMGWRYDYTDQHNERRYSNGCPSESEKYLTMWFSSYNGLMPIVLECHKSDYISFTMSSTSFHVCELNTIKSMRDRLNNYPFDKSEESFIEAIQLAVIKYLKLKNEAK